MVSTSSVVQIIREKYYVRQKEPYSDALHTAEGKKRQCGRGKETRMPQHLRPKKHPHVGKSQHGHTKHPSSNLETVADQHPADDLQSRNKFAGVENVNGQRLQH